jgi:flagellar basal-body rod protein FlgC
MNLFGMMDISSSALRAERVRAEVVASNMANAETTRTEDGGPYRRHHVVFSTDVTQSFGHVLGTQIGESGGVSVAGVVQDEGAPLKRFDPGHPDAGADGYVSYPDINPLTEMVDLMGAQRAYGMNASAVQAEKGMIAASLDILK